MFELVFDFGFILFWKTNKLDVELAEELGNLCGPTFPLFKYALDPLGPALVTAFSFPAEVKVVWVFVVAPPLKVLFFSTAKGHGVNQSFSVSRGR